MTRSGLTPGADSAILPAEWVGPEIGDFVRFAGEGDVDRMDASRFAALWLLLLAAASMPEVRAGVGGVVAVEVLDVLDEPDDAAFSSGRLRRGDRVEVTAKEEGGWLAIEPPEDAFDWVAQDAIREESNGRARVVADQAPVRSGCPGARMPGPPRAPRPKGSVVTLVDLPPLTTALGRSSIVWRAIRPGGDEPRFVRSEGIRLDRGTPYREGRQDREPPAEVVATVPATDAGAIDETASRFDAAVARSRQRDHEVDLIRSRLQKARATDDRGYDARGFLQSSSRKVDGQKVHALIGPKGVPVAYLDIPPGIATAPLLTRKVGVRGSARFVESLGTSLIRVRDIDLLDDLR